MMLTRKTVVFDNAYAHHLELRLAACREFLSNWIAHAFSSAICVEPESSNYPFNTHRAQQPEQHNARQHQVTNEQKLNAD